MTTSYPDQLRLPATASYYASFIMLGLQTSALAPVVPLLAERTHSRLDQFSITFAMSSFGYMLGGFLGGRLYDRMRGHVLMSSVIFASGALLALIPFIPHLALLVALVMVLGFMQGTLDTGGNTLLVWVHGPRVGPFMNGLHFFFGIGAFLSPILIAQATQQAGNPFAAYWLIAFFVIPIGFFLLRQPSPPAPIHGEAQHQSSRPDIPLLSMIIALFFLYVGAEIGFGNWIYTYALKLNLANEVTAAYLTSGFWGAFTIGRLLGIPLAARFRPNTILLTDLLGCIASLAIILIGAASSLALWAGALGTGFFMASVFATAMTLAGQRLTLTGATTGLLLVGTGGGSMFLPWLIGQLFERFGPTATMWVIFADIMVTLGLLGALILYHPRARSKS